MTSWWNRSYESFALVTRYPGLKPSPYTEGTGNFDKPLPSNPKHIGVLAHPAVSLGLSACRQGHRVCFVTAAGLINELIKAASSRLASE
jgi:hypothetical protein